MHLTQKTNPVYTSTSMFYIYIRVCHEYWHIKLVNHARGIGIGFTNVRSYLQTLQLLTTIHSGFLGRASWLAKNNIWLLDSQPLPSLNRAEMRKPNLHDSACCTIQHSVYTIVANITGTCLHIPYCPFTGCAKQLALIRVD